MLLKEGQATKNGIKLGGRFSLGISGLKLVSGSGDPVYRPRESVQQLKMLLVI